MVLSRQGGSEPPATASVAPPDHSGRLTLIALPSDTAGHNRAEQRGVEHHSAEARQLALEINDSIVQGLVLVQITLSRGCGPGQGREQGLEIVERMLATARRIASDLLGEQRVEPGDLVRSPAAGPASLDGPRP